MERVTNEESLMRVGEWKKTMLKAIFDSGSGNSLLVVAIFSSSHYLV